MLGQRPDRYKIDAGGGKFGQGIEGDITGYFQLGAALIDGDSLTHHGNIEVVQHHDIGVGCQRLFQLGQRFDLYLYRFARIEMTSLINRFGNSAAGKDMVLFDEIGVVETDAVVLATTTGYRVLLGSAQTRDSLAGVEQPAIGLLQLGDIASGESGNAGEGLDEVQRIALAGQQQAGWAVEAEQLLIGRDHLAILHLPLHLHLAAELGL